MGSDGEVMGSNRRLEVAWNGLPLEIFSLMLGFSLAQTLFWMIKVVYLHV